MNLSIAIHKCSQDGTLLSKTTHGKTVVYTMQTKFETKSVSENTALHFMDKTSVEFQQTIFIEIPIAIII